MILALDIGNSSITIGGYAEDALCFTSCITTDRSRMEDQYAVDLRSILSIYDIPVSGIDGAIVSSVVPTLTSRVCAAVEKIIHRRPLLVGPGIKTGLNIRIDNPATLGADIVAGCVAALDRYPLPCIVCDLGTATSISVLNEKGVMVGGALLPGVLISLEALRDRTSLLTQVALQSPSRVIGTNTESCMVSGSMVGTAAMLDGMVERMEKELGQSCTVVGTGSIAGDILPLCHRSIVFDEHLMLDGLYLLYRRNTKAVNPA